MTLPYDALARQQRVDLNQVVPLPAPYLLWVDPSSVCNLRCPSCPHGGWGQGVRVQRIMTPDLWRTIVAQVKRAGWRFKTASLYGMGEPLWNRNIVQMVIDATRFSEKTIIATNGTLLTPDMFKALDAAGLTYLRISCYKAHIQDQVAKAGECVRAHPPSKRRQMRLVAQAYENEPEVGEMMRGIADDIIPTPWHDWTHAPLGARTYDVCSLPFYCVMIHPDGDVCHCLGDYRKVGLLGNVTVEPLDAIWNGPVRLARERTMLAGGCDAVTPCRWCNGGHNRDNVRRRV